MLFNKLTNKTKAFLEKMEEIKATENRWLGNLKIENIFNFWVNIYIVFLFSFVPKIYCQSGGFKFYKNYSPKEYDHLAQNWGVAQSKNGLIYVANHGGILEYDGVSWRIIGIPKYFSVRSLAIDESDTIYVGGTNKLGYLAPDQKGSLHYISLLEHLDENEKNFSNIWSTHATPEGIYFRASKFLFQWNSKKMKVWRTPEFFRTSFICNGDFIVHEKNKGLLKMNQGSMQLLPGTDVFAEDWIFFLTSYTTNNTRQWIMWVHKKGFFLYDGNIAKPFTTEVDDYLKEKELFQGIRLTSGDFAFATLHSGLVIMDKSGQRKYIFDTSAGLQDNCIYSIFEDIQKNLWLCLSKGISKVEYSSPFSIYDKRSNLPGLVLSVLKHQHELYAGTSAGIFHLQSHQQFRLLPGIAGPCWCLISNGDSLLAATNEGVFLLEKNKKHKILQLPSYILLSSKNHPGIIWCGTLTGVAALSQKNGKWIVEHQYETNNQAIRSISEDRSGNLWLGTVSGGVFKLDFPGNIIKPVITHFGTSQGLPEGEINVSAAAGHIMFTTAKGLYRFHQQTKTFVSDETLGIRFAGDNKPVFRLIEDKNNHIWFHSESRNFQAIPQDDGSFKINSKPFLRIPTTAQVNAIFSDPDKKIIWFASNEGLICYDTTIKKNFSQDFQTLVRRIIINENQKNEKLIFDGSEYQIEKISASLFPIIEYKDRNLHFEFAAPFFEAESETRYRYFLEGYDEEWSNWAKETKRNYTNISPGMYTFRVQVHGL
jgi:ligand-binding sensor domain-containing protein